MTDLSSLLDLKLRPDDVPRAGWGLAVFEEVQRFSASDADHQRVVRESIAGGRSWVLLNWAADMASLGVREADRERLVVGLVGLSLFNDSEIDGREALVIFQLLVRAATLTGESPVGIVGDAALRADKIGAAWISGHLPPSSSSPPNYEEVGHGKRFAFVRKREMSDPMIELADLLDDPGR